MEPIVKPIVEPITEPIAEAIVKTIVEPIMKIIMAQFEVGIIETPQIKYFIQIDYQRIIYKFTLYSEYFMEFHLFNHYYRNFQLSPIPLQFKYRLNLSVVEVTTVIMGFILAIIVIKVIIILAKLVVIMDWFIKQFMGLTKIMVQVNLLTDY